MPTTIRSVRGILIERERFERFCRAARVDHDEDLGPEDLLSLYLSDRALPTGKVGRPPSADTIILRVATGWDRAARSAELLVEAARTRFARGTAPPPMPLEVAPPPLPPPPDARFVGDEFGHLEDVESEEFEERPTVKFEKIVLPLPPEPEDALDRAEYIEDLPEHERGQLG